MVTEFFFSSIFFLYCIDFGMGCKLFVVPAGLEWLHACAVPPGLLEKIGASPKDD
jgi:hypothetical protein